MASVFDETERKLRELGGVLDMALLLAVDVICEHDSHGLSTHEWQRRLIGEAAKKLTVARRFSGRLSLFSDEELKLLYSVAAEGDVEVALDALAGEIEFELARRGVLGEVTDAGGDEGEVAREAGDDAGSDGERGVEPRVEGDHV